MNRSWYWWALFGALATAIALLASADAWAAYDPEDLVCETTTDTGTSRTTISLSGTACDNYLTFAAGGVATGSVVTYTMQSGDGKIETGYATFTDAAPDTLTSVTVLSSSDGVATAISLTGTTSIYLNWNTYSYDGGVYPVSFANVEVEGSTAPVNGMYLISASALGFATNSTGRLRLGTTQFFPVTTDGIALGTTTNMFSDLFVADGAVLNWNNGGLTITATPSSLPYFQFDGSGAYAALNVDGGSSEGGKIRVQEADANGSNAAVFEAAASLASDKTCTLTSDTQMIPASCVNRTGEFFWWTTATCPSTYSLPTNGAAVSRTTYAELFAVISTTYGVGDGSTTFNVPDTDTDNRFIRAADGTTITIATTQTDAVEAHTHSHDNNANRAAGGGQYTTSGGGSWSSGAMNSGTSDTETRPNNIALRGCIFY